MESVVSLNGYLESFYFSGRWKISSSRRLHLRNLLIVVALLLWAGSSLAQSAPEVWLSTNDPTYGGAKDFWSMFQPGADWASAKSHVRVVSIAQNLVTNGPPDKLKSFYAYLKQNNIKLEISIGMLTWSDQCGKHVEGYVAPGGSGYVAKRLKWLGGEPSYIDIDEALWYGRYYGGKGACHTPLEGLAKDVAANFKAYRDIFPNVQLGDTEPFGGPQPGEKPGEWESKTQNWIDLLQAATGTHLAYIHEDITDWTRPLPSYLPAIAGFFHSNHIPFAPIVIAADWRGPDDAWMRSAEHNIDLLRESGAWPPDHLAIATWHAFPTHNLPDSSPTAFTHLIDYYFAAKK